MWIKLFNRTWNCNIAKFSGRWNTARRICLLPQNAKKHNADGILLTTWGDCGNHQPWSTLYPPLLGAQLFWNGLNVDDDKIGSFVRRFRTFNMRIRKSFIELAKLDQVMDFDLPNNSLHGLPSFQLNRKIIPTPFRKLILQISGMDMAWLMELNKKVFFYKSHASRYCRARMEAGHKIFR